VGEAGVLRGKLWPRQSTGVVAHIRCAGRAKDKEDRKTRYLLAHPRIPGLWHAWHGTGTSNKRGPCGVYRQQVCTPAANAMLCAVVGYCMC